MKERETFEMFDRDGNGTISKSELGKIMHALGQDVTQKELEDILTRFDDDREYIVFVFCTQIVLENVL